MLIERLPLHSRGSPHKALADICTLLSFFRSRSRADLASSERVASTSSLDSAMKVNSRTCGCTNIHRDVKAAKSGIARHMSLLTCSTASWIRKPVPAAPATPGRRREPPHHKMPQTAGICAATCCTHITYLRCEDIDSGHCPLHRTAGFTSAASSPSARASPTTPTAAPLPRRPR